MNRGKLIEAGHYYSVFGPTVWSSTGVAIAQKQRQSEDKTMLFIDDFHSIENVSEHEKKESVIDLDFKPDYIVYESEMLEISKEILQQLLSLSNKKRAKLNTNSNIYFLSDFPITKPNGNPCCVLLDAALSVYKHRLGFEHIVNVLPFFYTKEQDNLLKILERIMPETFQCEILLFDENGFICNKKVLHAHAQTEA